MNTLELLGRGPRWDSDVRCPGGGTWCYYRDWSWLLVSSSLFRGQFHKTLSQYHRDMQASYIRQWYSILAKYKYIINSIRATLQYIFYCHEAASCEPEWSMLNVSKLPVNHSKPSLTLNLVLEGCFWRCLLSWPPILWDLSFPCDNFLMEGSHFLQRWHLNILLTDQSGIGLTH